VPAGVIDQDAAHHLRGDAKEVRPILPVDLALIDHPQVNLVNERRRLQCVGGAFASELAAGHATQLRIDQREQLIQSTAIAAAPVGEKRRHVNRRSI
jgi:hypothetical protein